MGIDTQRLTLERTMPPPITSPDGQYELSTQGHRLTVTGPNQPFEVEGLEPWLSSGLLPPVTWLGPHSLQLNYGPQQSIAIAFDLETRRARPLVPAGYDGIALSPDLSFGVLFDKRGSALGHAAAMRRRVSCLTSLVSSGAAAARIGMGFSLGLLLCVSTGSAGESKAGLCDGEVAQRVMAHALYLDRREDADFHLYICGDEPCTEEEFRSRLSFRQETLRDAPFVPGCIVEPLQSGTNSISALFRGSGSTLRLELVFSGIYLSTDRENRGHGFKALIGSHREEGQPDERFVWNGHGYELSGKRAVPPLPPEASPVCLDPAARSAMTRALYGDTVFRHLVCDDPSCTERDFDEHMSYRQTRLRDEPPLTGCFAEPTERGEKSLTGVFSITEGVPQLQLIYAGTRIDTDPKQRDHGYARLVGMRRQSATAMLLRHYRWNGKGYVISSVTRARARSDF